METYKQGMLYTIEDIYALPDGERAELIDGQLYDMAPPSTKHQRILSELHYQIKTYISAHGGKCEVFPAPFAVFLNQENNKNYVEPDLSVICDPDKLDDRGCQGAPDWVIEIVSPGSKSMDYYKNLFLYRTAGVREYWVVDPDRTLVTVYHFEQDTMVEYPFGEDIAVGIYGDLSLQIA